MTEDQQGCVVFRLDASDRLGGGHLMRCLALADALAARGVSSMFVCAVVPPVLEQRVGDAGHRLLRIEPAGDDGGPDVPLSPSAQELDAVRSLEAVAGLRASWLVLDHYGLAAPWEEVAGARAERTLVIDDLADRRHACDVLLDQTLGRAPGDYEGLVPDRCQLLLGPLYALLRPEFAQARPHALRRRRSPSPVRRVLVSLGATDVGGVTARVLEVLTGTQLNAAFDVVLGSGSPSLPNAEAAAARDSRVVLHIDSREMAALMVAADVAVGASGISSWERCCLGLPTITLVLADNQRLVAAELARIGAVHALEAVSDVGQAAVSLADDAALRLQMIAAAAPVTDGGGAAAVAAFMLDGVSGAAPGAQSARPPGLHLRPADGDDVERLWLWRNDPGTRAVSKASTAPVPWPAHESWYARVLSGGRSELWILEADGAPVGTVRFDHVDGVAAVSISIAPQMRGRGLGTSALELACTEHDRTCPGIPLVADVLSSNTASRRIFEMNGFRGDGASGEFLHLVRPPGGPSS